MDMFPDTTVIHDIQRELDSIIQEGVTNITKLIRATESRSNNGLASLPEDDADDELQRKRQTGKASGGKAVQGLTLNGGPDGNGH